MRVLFLTIGNRSVASSRVRVYSYIPYLREKEIDFLIFPYTPFWQCRAILECRKEGIIRKALNKIYCAAVLFIICILAPFFDVIYIQKVALSPFSFAILHLLNQRIAFDFDDALHLHKDIRHIWGQSACVIASNEPLARAASAYNAAVYTVISPVRTVSMSVRGSGAGPVTLGWIGSPEATRYLKPLLPVFKELKNRFPDLKIVCMGAYGSMHFRDLGIEIPAWSLDAEERFLSKTDIGIMPLDDDEWSRAKAGYKLLLCMSRGMACVASPVGVNNSIIQDGVNGYFAKTPGEWVERVSTLVADNGIRRKIGTAALESVSRQYTYDIVAPGFIRILKDVAGGRLSKKGSG